VILLIHGMVKEMNVVIAGGTGFLGTHVSQELKRQGHSVLLLSRGTREASAADREQSVVCDVAAGDLPLEPLKGRGAVVNLVGIKREEGDQTFERVHVEATRNLIAAAKNVGIRRFIHISVVCSRPDPESGYHDTKWRAEELVRSSGLDFTILKPGVIFGKGDDMVTHLVKMVRFAPLFPVVGKGDSILQPVCATEVAVAVAAALERRESVGKCYDIVGPERMTLRQVVRTVAEGMGLRTWIINTPVWLQHLSVKWMNAVFRNPLSTPAQLQMLIDGLAGDPEPAKIELSLCTRGFSRESVKELEGPIPPLFGFSLRLLTGRR